MHLIVLLVKFGPIWACQSSHEYTNRSQQLPSLSPLILAHPTKPPTQYSSFTPCFSTLYPAAYHTMCTKLIRQRLQEAPYTFLTASSSSVASALFAEEWSALHQDVVRAQQLEQLDDDDLALVHATASIIASISDGLSAIHQESDGLTASLVGEMEEIFSRLSIGNSNGKPDPNESATTPFISPSSRPLLYNAPALTWIQQNLHNPYPTSDVKRQLSRASGVSVGAVNSWFKEVRRRMGWVSLCQAHFQSSRALAVEALRQVHLSHHLANAPRLSPHVMSDFQAMKPRLLRLFTLDTEEDYSSCSESEPLLTSTYVDCSSLL